MLTLQAIDDCAAGAPDYPALAAALKRLGLHSYTVDVASHATLFRSMDGEIVQRPGQAPQPVAAAFRPEALAAALGRVQRKETDYAGFMNEIAAAGVRRYEAVLAGPRPRCIYFGADACVEEPIPL
jgi:uncharacterized protein YbcV (DUF1398 family)